MTRRLVPLVLAGALLLAGCSDGAEPETPRRSTSESASGAASQPGSVTPTRSAVATPPDRACYRLDFAEAVSPTVEVASSPCSGPHTSMTFAVGALDVVVDGHLLAVDSARVRRQVARTCPERFAAFVGGTTQDQRLSMLKPVWFTPTVEESDAGASWYRCDVVALAAEERLAPLSGRLQGVLGRADGRDRYGMCGTAEPGTPRFRRVICSASHTWRAIATVPFEQARYPGVAVVRAAGEEPCRDAGAGASGGRLDYTWGYEWPTAAQWRAGQRYGLCWAPD